MGRLSFTEYFHLLLTGREPDRGAALLPRPAARRDRRARHDADQRRRADDAGRRSGLAAGSGRGRDPRLRPGDPRDRARSARSCSSTAQRARRRRAATQRTVADEVAGRDPGRRASRLPGFGHPVHRPVDPRAERILELADARGVSGPHVLLARCLRDARGRAWGRPLTMNVSMPIAAVMLDLGFAAAAVKAVPILARTAGLLAHLAEEQQDSVGFLMASGAEEAIVYEARGRPRLMLRRGDRDATMGGAAGRRRRDATAPSSPTCSSAQPSIARSSRRPGSPSAPDGGRAGRDRAAAADRQARAAGNAARRRIRSAPTCARRASEIVRIYSTSGTTGTPSYIPLTAGDLENWVTGSARSYAASGVAAGAADRLDLQRRAVRGRSGAGRVRPHRALPHPGRAPATPSGCSPRSSSSSPQAAVLTPSYAAYLIEWAAERDVDLARLERRARARRGRARRRRAGLPGPARAGLGREGHRGDGDRRHRRLAVGRVRAAGRDAPRRARDSSTPS